jgi:hypothetical protein
VRGAAQNIDRRAQRGVLLEQVDVRTIAPLSRPEKNVERQSVRHAVQQMLLRPIFDALCESSPALLLRHDTRIHRELRHKRNGRRAIRQTRRKKQSAITAHAVAQRHNLAKAAKNGRKVTRDVGARRGVPGATLVDDEELPVLRSAQRLAEFLLRQRPQPLPDAGKRNKRDVGVTFKGNYSQSVVIRDDRRHS